MSAANNTRTATNDKPKTRQREKFISLSLSEFGRLPARRHLNESGLAPGPLVQRSRVEVSPVRPYQRVKFCIKPYLIEQSLIPKKV